MAYSNSVEIRAEAQCLPWCNLVPILESLMPIRFCFSEEHKVEAAGEIRIEDLPQRVQARNVADVSSLTVPWAGGTMAEAGLKDIAVAFADDADVPFPFRGRSLRAKVAAEPKLLSLSGKERILAASGERPVWVVSEARGVRHFRSGLVLPGVPPEGNLRDVLNGERFLEMLPLLQWLRQICAANAFQGPPWRACFMFDDPNLHWPRYGFVDFKEIARHAAKENFHVAFATIPLDTWFTHQPTAEVFRTNPRQLSLLVHGNDHTKGELGRQYAPTERVALLQQAVRRIERLERATGLRVSRVMVPPHGVCSEEMLADLPKCGFEAACLSHGSLRAHNAGRPWTKNLGYLPSELIQGCPVLPRWGLSTAVTNAILLAAFLQQPIILRGHHRDLKDGVELLDQLAGFINRVGRVSWSSMADLSRGNYQWRMEGSTCRLVPLGRKLAVQTPKSATALKIEYSTAVPWDHWSIAGLSKTALSIRAGESLALPEAIDGTISLEVSGPVPVPNGANLSRSSIAPFCRRVLTESRDRLLSLCE